MIEWSRSNAAMVRSLGFGAWAALLASSLWIGSGCSHAATPAGTGTAGTATGSPEAAATAASTSAAPSTAAPAFTGEVRLPSQGGSTTTAPLPAATAAVTPPQPPMWKLVRTLETKSPVGALAISPNQEWLVAGGRTTVELWKTSDDTQVKLLHAPAGAAAVAFNHNSSRLAVANGKPAALDKVLVWKAPFDGPNVVLEGHVGLVSTLAFSALDPQLLATGGGDRMLLLWSLDKPAVPLAFRGHRDYISQLAFSPDGKHLAAAGGERTVVLWDVATRQVWQSSPPVGNFLTSVVYSPDGKFVVAGDGTGVIHLFDITAKTQHSIFAHSGVVTSLAFSPSGKLLASAGADRHARLWDVTTRTQVAQVEPQPDYINALCFTADGAALLTGGEDSTIKYWEVPEGLR